MKILNTQLSITYLAILMMTVTMAACQSGTQQQTNEKPNAPKQTVHEAAFMGNVKAMKQHIDAGSNLNTKDPYGSTALTIAITFNKSDVAKLLIESNADIHATSADGSTPLHTASFLCRIDIVEALLAKGANKTLTNTYGSTPLQALQVPFENVQPVYDQLSRDLGPLGFKLDYDFLMANRPVVAALLTAE